ncbi:MAG: patatin family protein [Solobacterium sp.]|nr:patatin family protein [Solobacterium sp.]
MIGIIDVSHNITGIYGAGVLDYYAEHNISFDYGAGVSSGGTNLVSYFSKNPGQSFLYYNDFALRNDYLNVKKTFEDTNALDIDLLFEDKFSDFLDYPFPLDQTGTYGIKIHIVATDALTGEPHYFNITEKTADRLAILKASSNIPVYNEPYNLGDASFFAGYLSDPLPFQKAFEEGCDKVILILARPLTYRRDSLRDRILSRLLKTRQPELSKAVRNLSKTYNDSIYEALRLQKEGKMLILSPELHTPLYSIIRDRKELSTLYQKGRQDAESTVEFLTK